MVGQDDRVCPECGNPAGERPFCGACGRNLATVKRLPRRSEWEDAQDTPPQVTNTSEEQTESHMPLGASELGLGPRLRAVALKRPLRYALGVAALVALVIVIILVTSGDGSSLNPTRVQVTLQDNVSSTSTGLSVSWSCVVGASGDPAWNGLGCNAQLTDPHLGVAPSTGIPYYEIVSDGANCFTATVDQNATDGGVNMAEVGLSDTINECIDLRLADAVDNQR